MSMMRRLHPLFLALFLFAPGAALAADARVELVNAETLCVSVPLGTDTGVTKESDFAAFSDDNDTVLLYPEELYGNMFWSRTLSPEEFSRLSPGSPVRAVTLPAEEHAELRKEGEAQKRALAARQEEARREATRKEIAELRERRGRLASGRDDLEARIASAEQALADEEGRLEWISSSEERDIDRALQNIQEYADKRDELQEQRNALSGKRPYPSAEINRLSAEIKRLNDQIASERDTIRSARDRKRSARSFYLSRRQEWQKLLAERNRATIEIRSIDRRIRELSGK